MPTCLECQQYVKIINYKHLKKCSSLSILEYRAKHPNTPLWDADIKKLCSHPGKLNGRWKDNKKFCSTCQKRLYLHNKTGFCIDCLRLIERPGTFLGKKHSLETRCKMKEAAKKRDKSTRYKIPFTKEIVLKREKTKKENWDKLPIEEKHNKLKNFMRAGARKKHRTSIEETVDQILTDFGMVEGKNYTRNTQVGGYNVDFLINEKFIIECYGDYWHKNPSHFNSPSDKIKRQKDLRKQHYLEDRDFNFIYFWEEDIHKKSTEIVEAIKKFLRSYYNIFEWEGCCDYQNAC